MMTDDNPQEETSYAGQLLEPGFVAKVLRVDRATVVNWAAKGTIDAITLPSKPGAIRKRYRIRGEALDKLLAK